MTHGSYIQFSFENLLRVVESAGQSTETRRSVSFPNSIIEHCIEGFWDNPQYKQELKHDETIFCRHFDPNGPYSWLWENKTTYWAIRRNTMTYFKVSMYTLKTGNLPIKNLKRLSRRSIIKIRTSFMNINGFKQSNISTCHRGENRKVLQRR